MEVGGSGMKEIRIIIRSINWLLLGINLYLINVKPIQINGVWNPSWTVHLDTIKTITFSLWIFTMFIELCIKYLIYKEKKSL